MRIPNFLDDIYSWRSKIQVEAELRGTPMTQEASSMCFSNHGPMGHEFLLLPWDAIVV